MNKQLTKGKKQAFKGFQVVEDECIWMKAGVINFRLCDNAYDCLTCPFDKGMQNTMNADSGQNRKHPAWAEKLRKQFKNDQRPCRHVLTGRIDPPKTCPNDYECSHCSFDQWLDETDHQERIQQIKCSKASGYLMADDYFYHSGHAWACFEHNGFVKVGFDDFLVRLFGTMDSIELPKLGENLKQGKPGWGFSREKHHASILSPVSGTVLAVNHKIADHPDILKHDPYNQGWLFMVQPKMPKMNIKRLYNRSESLQWMEKESRKLMGLINPKYEKMAATGGEPIYDVFGNIPELGWDLLVDNFLNK